VIGHGADVAARAAGSHNQTVGDGTLAFDIDEDDVLGLVVFQAAEDQFLDRIVAALGGQ